MGYDKSEAQGGAQNVLIFWPNRRLVLLIIVLVLIKRVESDEIQDEKN